MSDTWQGDGWWQASDGKWYPPQPQPQPQPPVGAAARVGPGYWKAKDGLWYAEGVDAPGQPYPFKKTGTKQMLLDATSSTSAPTMFTAALVGAVVIVVGALLPWVTVSTAFGTISVSGTEGDGVITLVCGVIAAALLVLGRGRKTAAILAMLVGGLVAAVGLYDLVNVSAAAADVNGLARASAGVGLWVTLVGGATTAVCSLVAAAQS